MLLPEPPVSRRMELLLRQVTEAVRLKGERVALREARKHAAWYMRGLRGAAGFRAKSGQVSTFDELAALCLEVSEANG